jgi:hypothetical protein
VFAASATTAVVVKVYAAITIARVLKTSVSCPFLLRRVPVGCFAGGTDPGRSRLAGKPFFAALQAFV